MNLWCEVNGKTKLYSKPKKVNEALLDYLSLLHDLLSNLN